MREKQKEQIERLILDSKAYIDDAHQGRGLNNQETIAYMHEVILTLSIVLRDEKIKENHR